MIFSVFTYDDDVFKAGGKYSNCTEKRRKYTSKYTSKYAYAQYAVYCMMESYSAAVGSMEASR